MGQLRSECNPLPPAISRTASSPSPSSDTNLSVAPPWAAAAATSPFPNPIFRSNAADGGAGKPNLELQLLTKASNSLDISGNSTLLQLSIGSSDIETENANSSTSEKRSVAAAAAAEKAYAEEARRQAKRQREVAEQEFANAKRFRQQAVADLEKAVALKEQAARQLNNAVLQITCHSCKQRFHHDAAALRRVAESSSSLFNISAALREWEVMKK